MESFYFAFGDSDVFTVLDLPDNEAATAIALTVNGSRAVTVRTSVLLTPEDVDAAAQRSVDYRPPGVALKGAAPGCPRGDDDPRTGLDGARKRTTAERRNGMAPEHHPLPLGPGRPI
jgi:hypothetical protein